jgi:hypothetical protein
MKIGVMNFTILSPSTIDAVRQNWLKLVQWFQRRNIKCYVEELINFHDIIIGPPFFLKRKQNPEKTSNNHIISSNQQVPYGLEPQKRSEGPLAIHLYINLSLF